MMPEADASNAPAGQAIQAYLSYSRRDQKLVDEFREQVARAALPLRLFYDMDIAPGGAWDEELRRQLDASFVVMFFLSPDAMQADYIWRVELPAALELHGQGRARVVPILLRECAWKETPLARFQMLPRNLRPVDTARPRSRAWQLIVEELRALLGSGNALPGAPDGPMPLPPGPERLQLALYAVLDDPARFDLLDHLDPVQLAAWWQQVATPGRTMPEVLAELAQRHGQQAPQPLWSAWVESVQPEKLGS